MLHLILLYIYIYIVSPLQIPPSFPSVMAYSVFGLPQVGTVLSPQFNVTGTEMICTLRSLTAALGTASPVAIATSQRRCFCKYGMAASLSSAARAPRRT